LWNAIQSINSADTTHSTTIQWLKVSQYTHRAYIVHLAHVQNING